jgi:cytochrome c oxidase assembly protein subunit 15
MSQTNFNPWLHRFAVVTAAATLALLGIGGLVTSHGVGMAVPDWPTTYGYNMFFFPFSKWTGGIFYEHSHRLVASGVGLLTTVLAVWLWLKESRARLRWLGVIAFFAVVLQGVLGGLRVVLFKDEIGIFHATLAQMFFALVCAIALFTSRWWKSLPSPLIPRPSDGRGERQSGAHHGLGRLFLFATGLIFLQLVLGATMRHQHAGLAVPDFPLAYGRLLPAMDADSIADYNARRIETIAANPITSFQVGLQMAHRLVALLILVCVCMVALRARRANREMSFPLGRLASFWLGLIFLQIVLGAWTIWSNKAADVATAHVLVGALSLVTGTLGCIIAFRRSTGPVEATALAAASSGDARSDSFAGNPAPVLNQ